MDFNIGGGDALIEQGCSSRFAYVGQHVQAVHVVARSWMRRVCACIRGSSGVQSGYWPCMCMWSVRYCMHAWQVKYVTLICVRGATLEATRAVTIAGDAREASFRSSPRAILGDAYARRRRVDLVV